MTKQEMEEEGNDFMLEACFPPEVSNLAHVIYSAMDKYIPELSNVVGGMGFLFLGTERLKVIATAKKLRNINLARYEPYMDMYIAGLKKTYEVKEAPNGN
jgi:hypothetical protein